MLLAGALSIVLFVTPLTAFCIMWILKQPFRVAIVVAAALAQIGEFSFILAALGISLGLLPHEGQSLILAGAILSIALNPLMFLLAGPLERMLGKNKVLAAQYARTADPLAELPMTTAQSKLEGQVVLVGYGRVGRNIAESLAAQGIHYVVAEQNRELVDQLRQQGIAAVAGNAGEPAVLIQAHIHKARMLVVATPDTFHVRAMIETARALNPDIRIAVRTHREEEAALLRSERAGVIFIGEQELAKSMAAHVASEIGKTHA